MHLDLVDEVDSLIIEDHVNYTEPKTCDITVQLLLILFLISSTYDVSAESRSRQQTNYEDRIFTLSIPNEK